MHAHGLLQVCNVISTIGKNTGLGKRDVTNCYECCPETNHTLTTPPCNAKLCGIRKIFNFYYTLMLFYKKTIFTFANMFPFKSLKDSENI